MVETVHMWDDSRYRCALQVSFCNQMNLIERVAGWVGFDLNASQQQLDNIQAALDEAKRLKHSNRYEEAITKLDVTSALATRLDDPEITVLLDFERLDMHITFESWSQAEQQLEYLRQTYKTDGHRAWILVGSGHLAYSRDEIESARDQLDQALKLARESGQNFVEGLAQAHLARIYLDEDNANFAAYLLEQALPKLATDYSISALFIGLLGKTKLELGQQKEGINLIGRALRVAEHLHYHDYEQRWRQELAIQAMAVGQLDEARKHFILVQSQMDKQALDYYLTLCRLSKTSLRLGDPQAALDYARQAAQSEKPLADGVLGIALRSAGKADEAIPYLERAAEHYTDLTITEADYSYVELMRNLAAARAETDQFDTARTTYEQILDYAQQADLPSDVAGIYRDIGIFHIRRGDFHAAVDSWTDALNHYIEMHDHARVARLYCDIANVRKEMGQIKRAMKDYEQALMLLSSVDDEDTRGIVLSNAAVLYIDHGDIESAESFLVESIKIALKLQDREAEATRRGNYGWFLVATGRAQRALATLSYALQQSESLDLKLQMAVQNDNLGLAHDHLKNYDEALKYHQTSLEIVKPLNQPYWQALLQANQGHTLAALGRYDEARPLFAGALVLGRQLRKPDAISSAQLGLGREALRKDDLIALESIAQEALEKAEQSGSRRLTADALTLRSEYYARNGAEDKATADWERAQKLFTILRILATPPTWKQ